MKVLNKSLDRESISSDTVFSLQENLPERVVQFGEGNFLRGFIDWMIHQLNKQGLFNGKVVAVQPTPHGKVVPKLNKQDGLYTLVLRGIDNGNVIDQSEIISSISRGINPYNDWEKVLDLAASPAIEFVFSNTTEAGISYQKESYNGLKSPLSFPGKLTAFLFHRYQTLGGSEDTGLTIIPCELLEGNGDLLKEIVIKICSDWDLPADFVQWIHLHNQFCNTLVDRIVTGYPADSIDEFRRKLGYEDLLLTVGEPYHFFAIDAGEKNAAKLPFQAAGLNVKWGDISKYRELKVRLLNGPHTMMFSTAYLAGVHTVLEAMEDQTISQYLNKGIEEIMLAMDMDEQEKTTFIASVKERFLNPYNKHQLVNIGMNAVFKFKSRLIPSLLEYQEKQQQLPQAIVFSLAALFAYYHPIKQEGDFLIGKRDGEEYTIRDNQEAVHAFSFGWQEYHRRNMDLKELVTFLLEKEGLWGRNLNEIDGLNQAIQKYLLEMLNQGMRNALETFEAEAILEVEEAKK